LADPTEDEKQQVANLLAHLDLRDPRDSFTLMFAWIIGDRMQRDKLPGEIEAITKLFLKKLDSRFAAIETAATQEIQLQHQKTQDEMADKLGRTLSPWGILRNTLGLVMAAIAGAGAAWAIAANQPLDPNGLVQLTQAEAEALAWLKTSEGIQVRNIARMNEGLASGECKREVKNSGIVFQVGGQLVEEGFCVVWVDEPAGKKYRDAN